MADLHAESGDSEIMQATTVKNGAFAIVINGEELHGSPLPGQPRAGDIIGWCDGVRNWLATRDKNAQADKRARRGLTEEEGGWKPKHEKVKPDPETGEWDLGPAMPHDPEEYLKEGLQQAKERMDKANAAFVKAQEEYNAAHAAWQKWSKIIEALADDG